MVKFLKKLWAFVLSFIPEGRYKYIDEYIDEDFEICTSTSYMYRDFRWDRHNNCWEGLFHSTLFSGHEDCWLELRSQDIELIEVLEALSNEN